MSSPVGDRPIIIRKSIRGTGSACCAFERTASARLSRNASGRLEDRSGLTGKTAAVPVDLTSHESPRERLQPMHDRGGSHVASVLRHAMRGMSRGLLSAAHSVGSGSLWCASAL